MAARLALTTMLLIALTAALADQPAPPAGPVPTADSPATPAPAEVVYEGQGLLRPSRRVELAMRVAGVIASRPVRVGDTVKAGQVIAELDSELERASLAITELKHKSDHEERAAKLSKEQALVELGRVKDLHRQSNATEWELKEAEVKAEIAALRYEYAVFQKGLMDLELKRDRKALEERKLLAPFAGYISKTMKDAGEAASEHAPIAELIQLDPLWLEINVPATYVKRIRPGQPATVTLEIRDPAGQVVDRHVSDQAVVLTVDPQVDAASSTFRVRVQFANKDGTFEAGLPAKAKFWTSRPTD